MAQHRSREERLQAVYAKVPKIACKRLCHENCGPIALHPLEHRRLEKVTGGIVPAQDMPNMQGLVVLRPVVDLESCPLLRFHECSQYDTRPLVCRLFGVVPEMPCKFGCVPERLMEQDEVEALMRELDKIGK